MYINFECITAGETLSASDVKFLLSAAKEHYAEYLPDDALSLCHFEGNYANEDGLNDDQYRSFKFHMSNSHDQVIFDNHKNDPVKYENVAIEFNEHPEVNVINDEKTPEEQDDSAQTTEVSKEYNKAESVVEKKVQSHAAQKTKLQLIPSYMAEISKEGPAIKGWVKNTPTTKTIECRVSFLQD